MGHSLAPIVRGAFDPELPNSGILISCVHAREVAKRRVNDAQHIAARRTYLDPQAG
jgi:hypothetical protein